MSRHNTEFRLYCVRHSDTVSFVEMWLTINLKNHCLITSHTVTVGMNHLTLFTKTYLLDSVAQVVHVRTITPLLVHGHKEVFMDLP